MASGHVILDRNPRYLFRGTTLGFDGNIGSRTMPYTCTTANPYKAALFAIYCRKHFEEPVIYFAEVDSLATENHLPEGEFAVAEEEIAWGLSPLNFAKIALGYVTLGEMTEMLRDHGFTLPASVSQSFLSEKCETMQPMDPEIIDTLVSKATKIIKKP